MTPPPVVRKQTPPARNAAIFGTRSDPPRKRSRSKLAGVLVVAIVLLASGYLLLMRHVDPRVAHTQIRDELESLSLYRGEKIERLAFIYQRSPWDYFRSSHGVLAATDRRLLVLTIAPTDRFAREIERAVVQRRDFPKDTTLRIETGRVMLGLAEGVRISAGPLRAVYAVPASDRAALRALMANVQLRDDSIHVAGREALRQRQLLAEAMRQPIWYRIRRGDALASVAQRFNTTPERLREINGISDDRIRVNDSIMIKGPGP